MPRVQVECYDEVTCRAFPNAEEAMRWFQEMQERPTSGPRIVPRGQTVRLPAGGVERAELATASAAESADRLVGLGDQAEAVGADPDSVGAGPGDRARVDLRYLATRGSGSIAGHPQPAPLPENPAPDRAGSPRFRGREVEQSPEEGTITKTDVLDLSLDEHLFLVRREGVEGVVDLAGKRLMWGLLKRFIACSRCYLTAKEVRDGWARYGRDDQPLMGTVYDAIGELRRMLKPLDVTIQNRGGVGYRLVDVRQGTAR